MKLTIETNLVRTSPKVAGLFIALMNQIAMCKDNQQLLNVESAMKEIFPEFNKYFISGFGSNHLWVKQIINEELIGDRLIFVEFEKL